MIEIVVADQNDTYLVRNSVDGIKTTVDQICDTHCNQGVAKRLNKNILAIIPLGAGRCGGSRMRILKEIYQQDLGFPETQGTVKYEIRKAARAVLFNKQGLIALMHVGKDDYYKLPGGGVEKGESLLQGLAREIREEVGTELKVLNEIGVVLEYRQKFELLQISYCYFCQTIGELAEPQLTQKEIANQFQCSWVELSPALELTQSYRGDQYAARFIVARDACILKKAVELMPAGVKS